MRSSLIALLLLVLAAPAWAHPTVAPHVQVELLADAASIQAGHDLSLGIQFTMEDGWHVYWRNPGDSGEAPSVQWTVPAELSVGALQWPSPTRLVVGPLVNFGYEGTILLPATLHVPARLTSAPDVDVRAHVKWLVCSRDECVPGQAMLSLALPIRAAPPKPTAATPTFDAIRARLPVEPIGLQLDATSTASAVTLVVRHATTPFGEPRFFPYSREEFENAPAPPATPDADGFQLELRTSQQAPATLTSLDGVLTVGPRAYAIHAPIRPAAFAPRASRALLFALAGGLLLNLMPCVFPVLAIKALALAGLAGERRGTVRLHGIAYALGVLVSFWLLAGALLALRAAGAQLGWGFQLQSPVCVAILASLFFWMALTLLGVSSVGGSIMGFGNRLTRGSGYAGAFFTGVLATVVATPCSAPFMGTAIGYALAQPAAVAFGVFTSLAVGLALPYVAITFIPAIGAHLPRPGRWMETLKQLLAFPLLATVVWLIWVVSLQAGPVAVATVLAALLMIGFATWITAQWTGRLATIAAAAIVIGALGLQVSLATTNAAPTESTRLAWEPYSTARVDELQRQGTPVFVDFTAAWCVTCQVNERLALAAPAVIAKMREIGVVTMRADWTSADTEITRALQRFGRDGVPLYVLYGGGAEAPPRILPQLLTSQIVVTELGRLQQRSRI